LLGAPSRLTRGTTANRIAAEGSPSSLLRLSPEQGLDVAIEPRSASKSLSDTLHALPPDDAARRAGGARRALLGAARA